MNDKIRELAEQADAYADAMDVGGKNYIGLRDEYFAELIVRECAKRTGELGKPEIGQGIMKHFGVKE